MVLPVGKSVPPPSNGRNPARERTGAPVRARRHPSSCGEQTSEIGRIVVQTGQIGGHGRSTTQTTRTACDQYPSDGQRRTAVAQYGVVAVGGVVKRELVT